MSFYERNKARTFVAVGIYIFVFVTALFLINCGGGSDEADITNGVKSASSTVYGIKFIHKEYYTQDELTDALRAVDKYYELALDCATNEYPELSDVIGALPSSALTIVVKFPDMFDSSTGREAFSCKFSEKGCAGTYSTDKMEIRITPSLAALGHEISHWINHMLFGETHDDDPEDLSSICKFNSICHLYAETRDLLPCQQ